MSSSRSKGQATFQLVGLEAATWRTCSGRSVDLGTPDTLRPEMRSEVRDLVLVPWLGGLPRGHDRTACEKVAMQFTSGLRP